MSTEPIEFWFDFTSPYSYLIAEKIDDLGARHGRKVKWHPILLGALFKTTGTVPLIPVPLKGEYSVRDFARSARFLNIAYRQPTKFPLATIAAARAYYWLHDRDCAMARAYAKATFRAYFLDDRDISDAAVVVDLAKAAGANGEELAAALGAQELKDRLKKECEAAIATGMFGAPYVIIDGEPFWGADRLPQIEKWLETGGF
ncbi:MAG: 2-hydroxychromene-2-carboxylate isomerase [Rhodopseudomonas sp.]|uniref:2-hydroxychromene-2-carboxylate isomerase n=1 Tax=Rhodopseudomonas sp. TaxID=1078 RepID=UPI001803D733|nr:2-hydroxychromene-2-carboxylate isomerase [Rhodopseudomonas sp.]NVN88918.1 2-hydroxychromene-2-carboxylate isomerase [Rhodopseudomonas sp.]